MDRPIYFITAEEENTMDKRLFKEIKRTDEKKIEDMLLQYIKTARKSFKCDIWQESLADERILTEDARCGDSTAQYLLSIYWLLKSADIYYPPAVKSIGILYGEMLKLPSAEKSYTKLCQDTIAFLREKGIDTEVAEALEIEVCGYMYER